MKSGYLDWDNFPFPVNKKYRIVAVLNDGSISILGHDEILRKVKRGAADVKLNSEKKFAKDLLQFVGQYAKNR